jgi:alpha-tubulin suppressor-like RCC1 family protein
MLDRPAPPSSDVLTGVKAIAAGGTHTCALTTAGGVRCWGGNVIGQLGDGTKIDRATPPTADVITDVKVVATGDVHTCVVTNAGGVRCWGHNLNAEVGNGTYLEQLSPPTSDALTGVKDVVAGLNFTCALTAAGGVRCWGYNSDGQIGDETETAVDRMAPAATDVLGGVQALGVGFAHTCALMTNGGVRCWGGNTLGQLGDGLAPQHSTTPPTMDDPGFTGTCP